MSSPENNRKIRVFEYDNYRQFLKDVYLHAKSEDSKFSFRYFARLAGFQSPNFLKRIIDGDRNLTESSITKLAQALKLNKEESGFFHHLVLLNQSKTADEKRIHAEKLLKSQLFKKIYPLKQSQFNYYNSWYFVPIRELVGLPGFKEDYDWISKKLKPSISPALCKDAVEQLLKLGLLERKPDGALVQSEADVSTGDQLTSASLAQFHREMAKLAGESIDRFPRDQRQVSAVTLGLSEESLKKIKEMVNDLQIAIVQMAAKEERPEKVYQVNFQVFPLTDKLGESPE